MHRPNDVDEFTGMRLQAMDSPKPDMFDSVQNVFNKVIHGSSKSRYDMYTHVESSDKGDGSESDDEAHRTWLETWNGPKKSRLRTTTGITVIVLLLLIPSVLLVTLTNIHQQVLDAVQNQLHPPPPANDMVIIYAYHESDAAWKNANFFLKHAVHDAADFVFIIIGDDTKGIESRLPEGMQVVKRNNTCYDLGSYGKVLTANDREVVKKYERFILINASLRGPFIPTWSDTCWSDAYTRPLKDGNTKLVGMTINCHPHPHMQSMILATDRTGIELLLAPTGLNQCYEDMGSAVNAEIHLMDLITDAGWGAHAMMSMAAMPGYDTKTCDNGDVVFQGSYNGSTLQPFDTMFVKSNRNIDETMIENYSLWMEDYRSSDVCRRE